jgi:membrane protein implicated in regulation of membrane protease activity
MSREPVRIKYWGLFWVTRFEYVLFNAVGWFIALMLTAVGVFMGVLPPLRCLWQPDPAWGVFAYFWWVLLACIAGQFFDAAIAWRKFARREEEQRRRRDDSVYEDDEPEASEGIMEKRSGYRRRRSDEY